MWARTRGSEHSVVSCADGAGGKKEPVTLTPTEGSSEDEQLFLETKGAGSLPLSHPKSGSRNKTSQEQAEDYYISCF